MKNDQIAMMQAQIQKNLQRSFVAIFKHPNSLVGISISLKFIAGSFPEATMIALSWAEEGAARNNDRDEWVLQSLSVTQ